MNDEVIELPSLDGVVLKSGDDALANITDREREDGRFEGQSVYEDMSEADLTGVRFLSSTDQPAAVRKARRMREALLDHGVPQVSIELVPGAAATVLGLWDSVLVHSEMSHHTASYYTASNLTPCLGIVKRGRAGLGGPLANGYGGWDLTYRIITFGWANHAGEGGPLTVPYKGGLWRIPADNANPYVWGTEWEGGLREADWDRRLRNPRNGVTMEGREFMGRANAGLRDFYGLSSHIEHKTWTDRKIDRLNYSVAKGTDELRPYLKENEVDQADIQKIAEAVMDAKVPNKNAKGEVTGSSTLRQMLTNIESDQERIGGRDRAFRAEDRVLLERIARKVGVNLT